MTRTVVSPKSPGKPRHASQSAFSRLRQNTSLRNGLIYPVIVVLVGCVVTFALTAAHNKSAPAAVPTATIAPIIVPSATYASTPATAGQLVFDLVQPDSPFDRALKVVVGNQSSGASLVSMAELTFVKYSCTGLISDDPSANPSKTLSGNPMALPPGTIYKYRDVLQASGSPAKPTALTTAPTIRLGTIMTFPMEERVPAQDLDAFRLDETDIFRSMDIACPGKPWVADMHLTVLHDGARPLTYTLPVFVVYWEKTAAGTSTSK